MGIFMGILLLEDIEKSLSKGTLSYNGRQYPATSRSWLPQVQQVRPLNCLGTLGKLEPNTPEVE